MAGLFDLLNTVIGKITQNSVTYATAPTPPSGDDSTKVATTAFVADKTAAIPSGNVAVWSRAFTHTYTYINNGTWLILYAPTGGTWFCWGNYTLKRDNSVKCNFNSYGVVVAGGSEVGRDESSTNVATNATLNNMMAIKIA